MWVPEAIEKSLIRHHVVVPLEHPELFDAKMAVPMTKFWFVFGREGLQKGKTLSKLLSRGGCYVDVPFADEKQHSIMLDILKIIEEGCAQILILDHGHRLALSRDDRVRDAFNHLVYDLEDRHMIVLCCCDIPTRQLPTETKAAYEFQGQFHFATPTPEWRLSYFKTRFENYKTFVAEKLPHITVEMDDTSYKYLSEVSEYTTVKEMERFVNLVLISVHKLDDVKRVVNYEFCKRFLKNKGGVYRLTEADPYALEQSFWDSAGMGMAAPEERSEATITNKDAYEGQVIESSSVRVTFDADGNEVVLGDAKSDIYLKEKKEEEEECSEEDNNKKKRARE
jgi:hypothetical protein